MTMPATLLPDASVIALPPARSLPTARRYILCFRCCQRHTLVMLPRHDALPLDYAMPAAAAMILAMLLPICGALHDAYASAPRHAIARARYGMLCLRKISAPHTPLGAQQVNIPPLRAARPADTSFFFRHAVFRHADYFAAATYIRHAMTSFTAC